ncbi:MAG: hypothetical protein HON47_05390 [Candidatus Diapherotrites archaeon]|jgi:hypothetical protein|uniref:Uncharacterized protein n=1 Tax=Candidatus Iainarchaeum sp. TaxID=3101447 RepID=A0A8T5GG73_9ARCH|nr:hypothetical protein [Candidatus Diapherotrites archaeon]MBT7241742.1 hypothetical protein [Candidatus Diapherotrites archaeon]
MNEKTQKKKFVESLDCDDLCYIETVKTKDDSKESQEMKADVEEELKKKKCGDCYPQK